MNFLEVEQKFRNIYPSYNPNKGMRDFAYKYWNRKFI